MRRMPEFQQTRFKRFYMKELLIIKSFPGGVNLIFNAEASFEELLEEVDMKFSASKSFFGKGNMKRAGNQTDYNKFCL